MHTHGMRKTQIYRRWASLKTRCLNPNALSFAYYGGRGITLCEAWHSFENFYLDMGECPPGMELDRIDNARGYTADNCRWVSREVNANNKRNNRPISYQGRTQNLGQWAKELGLSHATLVLRLKQGRPLAQVLARGRLPFTTPSRRGMLAAFGETRQLLEWCSITGLKPTTIRERLRRGASPEEALTRKVNKSGRLS